MRMRTLFVAMVLAVLSCPPAWAQGEPDGDAGMDAAAMEKMMPGPEHEVLAKRVGTWSVSTKIWMDPSQNPMESIGTAEFKLVMDGRFLHQEYKGEMMGMPFTGWGFDGFDRVTGKWTSFWIDSMSTSPTSLTGTSADGGKTIEFTGDMSDCASGTVVKTRWVATHSSDDESRVEMYVTHGDKEEKAMELVYKRKKQ